MLVSVDELATYMDQPRFSNRQEEAAELVLAGVQSELETILRRPIEVDEFVETYTVPEDYLMGRNYYSALSDDFLPFTVPPYPLAVLNSPVIEITQVRFKPAPAITPTDQWNLLTAGVDYTVRKWGLDIYRVAANDLVEVTYTAGLNGATIPFLKLSILRAAAREMTNQVDDVVGLKDLQTNDVNQQRTGFTEEEIRVLRKWRRKQPVG
jgi:hypothetical protein